MRRNFSKVIGLLSSITLGIFLFFIFQNFSRPGSGETASPLAFFGYNNVLNNYSSVTGVVNMARLNLTDNVAAQFAQYHVRTFLSVRGAFFKTNNVCDWDPNYQVNWNALVNKLVSGSIVQDVIAFYLIDEPYWSSLDANLNPTCSTATVLNNLTIASQTIKASFPTIPVAIIEAWPMIEESSVTYPASIDWLGFDCYPFEYSGGSYDSCGRTMASPYNHANQLVAESIPDFLQLLKRKMNSQQKVLWVPPAFLRVPCSGGDCANNPALMPGSTDQQKLAELTQQFLDQANSDPKIVAVYPWGGETAIIGGSTYFGSITMPVVDSVYRNFGKGVVAKDRDVEAQVANLIFSTTVQ
jgi:hypothetical protein